MIGRISSEAEITADWIDIIHRAGIIRRSPVRPTIDAVQAARIARFCEQYEAVLIGRVAVGDRALALRAEPLRVSSVPASIPSRKGEI